MHGLFGFPIVSINKHLQRAKIVRVFGLVETGQHDANYWRYPAASLNIKEFERIMPLSVKIIIKN